MRIDRERGGDGPVIDGIVGGGFRVDEKVYRGILLTPASADGWTPPPLAALGEADLAGLLASEPPFEFLLLGTGARLARPPAALARALDARGIGLEAMDSRAAARAWSVLRAERRWIAGALYPLD